MQSYELIGVKCGSCIAKINAEFTRAGLGNIRAELDPPRLIVESASSPGIDQLNKILAKAGDYRIEDRRVVKDAGIVEIDQGERLAPLFVVLGYIVGGVLLRAVLADDYDITTMMGNFMGGFFIVFSMFKLLNLSGFADAFSTYDLLAKRIRAYALAYPFIELFLGIAYFFDWLPVLINSLTMLVMFVGLIGVKRALQSGRRFQCACLGTALNLPMTKVTLAEDLIMGLMAMVMLWHQVGS